MDRRARFVLVALGVAAGAALLAGVLTAGLAAQDGSIGRATGRLAPANRAVRTIWVGVPGQAEQGYGGLDAEVGGALRPLGLGRPVRALLLREYSFHGRLAQIGALDGLGRFVRLHSGRLPSRCTAARCEVIQLSGTGPLPVVPGLRIVRVGRGALTSRLPFGDLLAGTRVGSVASSAVQYHQAAAVPLLLANGVDSLVRAPALADLYRSYVWALPLRPGSVHEWSLDDFAGKVTRARSQLQGASFIFDLTAPTDDLQAAGASARVAGRRLLLIGGGGAALLLAFTVLAAGTLRRDVDSAWRRLTWFGARRWQLVAVTATEAAVTALAGAAVGWAAGVGLGALAAHRLGAPAWPALAHSALAWSGLRLALLLALAAALVLLAALRARPARVGGLSVGIADVAAAGALAAILLALARGNLDATGLAAGNGTGVLLLLLPGLVAFVAAVVTARVLSPALRGVERAGRRGPVPLRLAALSLARHPGQATVAVTFLVVSLGLALFAASYRQTMVRGQTEQANYAVPADLVVREDLAQLVPVLSAAAPARYGQLGHAVPVLRLTGEVSRLEGAGGFTLLGVPTGELPRTGGWRSDFSSASLGELARRIAPARPVSLRGTQLPAAARTLTVPVSVRGDDLLLSADLETPRGLFAHVPLGQTAGARTVELKAAIPPAARAGRLVGFTFALANTGLHGVPNGGQNANPVAHGTLTFGELRADATPIRPDFARWTGSNGITGGGANRMNYIVGSELVSRFRPRQATDGKPVPVLVSPALAGAASGGTVPLLVEGQQLEARVAGVVERFPSTEGQVVVADAGTLETALNADAPGAGAPNEIWLSTRDPERAAAALRRPPFDALAVESRAALARDLHADPLARGALLVLGAAAVAALALALLGLLLGLAGDLQDETGELHDLEAQGEEPAGLRRHLRLRSLAVAVFGLLGGLAAGAILSRLVVDLVLVTAGAAQAEPPLRLEVSWVLVAAAVAAYAVLALVLVAIATGRAFREPAAGRFSEAGA